MKRIIFINIVLTIIFACSNNHPNKKVSAQPGSLSPTTNEQKNIIKATHDIKPNGKCDIEFLAHIEKLIEQNAITENEITGLFQTISDSCKNNVEFSEYSNEILFKTLEIQPEIFVDKLSTLKKSKQMFIINELTTPVSDKYELKNIIIQIKDTAILKKIQKMLFLKSVL